MVGYATHGAGTHADALSDYATFTFGRVCRAVIVAALMATYPLIALEGIANLGALLARPPAAEGAGGGGDGGGGGGGGGAGGSGSRNSGLNPLSLPMLGSGAAVAGGAATGKMSEGEGGGLIAGGWTADLATGWRSHRALASMWVVLSALLAATVTNTGKVMALVGAICSIPQMFIMPPLMAIYAEESVGNEALARGAPRAIGGLRGSYIVLGLGVILFFMCTYASLKHCVDTD